ncbi:uncharacterized protein [Nicotiana tomentosiformis]|uniref:uncharacterized protein n=1 Tax=Nicotiana tomentosiformis TaxID=4098 RepID=UPI00388CD94A
MVEFAQAIENHKLKNIMEREGTSTSRSAGNFGESFGGGRSAFRGGSSGPSHSFAQYSASAPPAGPRLPCTTRKFDSIWVVVDRLIKSGHFLPVKATDTTEQYAQLYIKEIVRLHGTSVSIISDRGAQFTANCWKKFQQGLGTQVAYKLEPPPEMSLVHPVFHVSMLKKVVGDSSAIVPVETIEVNEELSYEEIILSILDKKVQKLRNKEIASVKVLWQNQQVEEATLEAGEEKKKKYPYLFE